jgi:hypothetical protein
MRRAAILLVAAAGLVGQAAPAQAGIFELQASVSGGGGFGRGTASAPSKDFFELVQGATFGGELDIELFFIDVIVDHYEFFDTRIRGSWTQFLLGLDTEFPMDDEQLTRATIGADAGLGVGTFQSVIFQPTTPVPISHKGATAELRLQADRMLGRFFSIGLDLRLGYHYLFDADRPINDPAGDPTSHGMHLLGGLALKFRLGL